MESVEETLANSRSERPPVVSKNPIPLKRPRYAVKVRLPRPIPGMSVRYSHKQRNPYVFGSQGLCCRQDTLAYAETALLAFNQKLEKEEPEYELVEALSCIMFPRYGFYHCNFIARQKNDSNAEDKLFFAELRRGVGAQVFPDPRICKMCCILGPRGTETGQFGCISCGKHPGLLQHPPNGFTNFHPNLHNMITRFTTAD